VGVGIQGQVGHPERRHSARRPPPQQRAHAREQLLALERLDQVVVGADVESFHARVQRVARGQHEDRRVVLVAAQLARDLDAVHPGETQVQNDQVGEEGLGVIQGLRAVVGELHVVALHAQRALEDLGDLLIVLDDEYADGTLGGFHAN
jgi:hypothetical protein